MFNDHDDDDDDGFMYSCKTVKVTTANLVLIVYYSFYTRSDQM